MNDIKRSEITEVIYDDVMLMTDTVEMDQGERVEMMVDIYDSADTRHLDLRTNTERHQPLQHTGSVSVKNRRHRAVEVCLCLLCVLLLTAVMMLCVYFTTERNQLLTHINNLAEEREQTLTKYEQILNNSKNLTEEKEQILTKYEQTLNHSKNLTEEREQINNKIDEIQHVLYEQDQRAENFKWIYYNFSFYYISSETKTWIDSRRDCQQRGADLVIINSKEEQEFLQKVAGNDHFWIGLKKTERVWKWTDGNTITKRYWRYQHPSLYRDFCAMMTSSGWEDRECNYFKKWICKRTILIPSLHKIYENTEK
ncbi:CD209 antigen-like protein C [Pimephales promelas]|nr:CD209 antigen-like protein C [Pimephales promelas]